MPSGVNSMKTATIRAINQDKETKKQKTNKQTNIKQIERQMNTTAALISELQKVLEKRVVKDITEYLKEVDFAYP